MGRNSILYICVFWVGCNFAAAEAFGAWTMRSAPPPLPGQSESCKQNIPIVDFTTDCENCPDLELVKCDIFLGSDSLENKMVFVAKNHNKKFARRSESARFGHVGINPGAAPAAPPSPGADAMPVVSASVAASAPTRGGDGIPKEPASFEGKTNVDLAGGTSHPREEVDVYPDYIPDNAMSESMPNSFSVGPRETVTLEVHGITDFPPIAACNDIVFMALNQVGIIEPQYLWNRNYACTIKPCHQLAFRQCEVHRGDPDKGKAGKGGNLPTSGTLKSGPLLQ